MLRSLPPVSSLYYPGFSCQYLPCISGFVYGLLLLLVVCILHFSWETDNEKLTGYRTLALFSDLIVVMDFLLGELNASCLVFFNCVCLCWEKGARNFLRRPLFVMPLAHGVEPNINGAHMAYKIFSWPWREAGIRLHFRIGSFDFWAFQVPK